MQGQKYTLSVAQNGGMMKSVSGGGSDLGGRGRWGVQK